jgi:hypothetical protein
MNQDDPYEWKVGDELYCSSNSNYFGKNKIVRETKTTFILDNDERIRKGQRRLIGHEYSSLYYSEKSDYGKVLKQKYERFTIQNKINIMPLELLSIEKLKKILKIIYE